MSPFELMKERAKVFSIFQSAREDQIIHITGNGRYITAGDWALERLGAIEKELKHKRL